MSEMSESEKISQVQSLIEKWDQADQFIKKTEAKSGQFSQAVIEKVTLEFHLKKAVVSEQIAPLVSDLQSSLELLKSELGQLKHQNSSYNEVEEELHLRHAIGALDEASFQLELTQLQESMSSYVETVQSFDEQITAIEEVLVKWSVMGGDVPPAKPVRSNVVESNKYQSNSVQSAAVPQSQAIPEIPEIMEVPELPEIDQMPELPELSFDEPNFEDDLSILGDVDSQFGMDFDQELPVIEEDEGNLSPFNVMDGEALDFELSDDNFGFEESVDLSADLIVPDEFSSSIEFSDMDLGQVVEQRSAILIRDEGTPNEAVFSFQGDIYNIGRSSDSDIQIKGDNKVSRNHCQLLRRDNQYFIKDLGSSNGTMVNGEVFKEEQKLLGGEELKIGETVFRFTIQ